jgi:hypothetical protein
MEKLIEQLLGRPFRAPGGEGGGGDGAGADGGGAQGGNGAGGDGKGAAGNNGGGADGGKGSPSAADIAARAGGAFARNSGGKGDANGAGGAKDGDDGIDPASKPKGGEGAGERPAHVPEKFWDAKTKSVKVDDAVKAYTTLESEFARLKGEKGWGKAGDTADAYLPEGIKFADDKKPDRIREIDAKSDPALGAFRKVAHKHKIPVDVAGALAADFLMELSPNMPVLPTEADILKELGEGAVQLRDTLGTWMGSLFDNKVFSESEIEWAFENFGKDARGVRVLAKLREMMGEKPIPLAPGSAAGDIPSKEEWYAMNRDPRMASDVAFREKVEALGEQIFGSEPAGTSEAGIGVPPPRKADRRERASTRA